MLTSIRKNPNVRLHGQGLLSHLLRQQELLTKIIVGHGGQILVQSESWEDYWAPFNDIDDQVLHDTISALKSTWMKYIAQHFPAEVRLSYCYHYFKLLDIITSKYTSDKQLLSHVLSFECFAISDVTTQQTALAAGTTTTRNPCYLLAKLKFPGAIEDSQYLPVITCPALCQKEIFYHYRQHKLPGDNSGTMLLYLAADLQNRLQSFSIINECESELWQATDPRVDDRADLIARRIIVPYLTQRGITSGTYDSTIEFVDLGAGSGHLTARICQELVQLRQVSYSHPCFRIVLIDLTSNHPARFFSSKSLRQVSDSFYSIGVDYQQWFMNEQRLPLKTGLRIGLVIRFLHNFSHFSIATVPFNRFSQSDQQVLVTGSYLPSHCLHSDEASSDKLIVSTTYFKEEQGHGYWQPSLSPFNHGLYLLKHPELSLHNPTDCIYTPIRHFNNNCLLTPNGGSIISKMLEDCDAVIIQDLDLTPDDLQLHCEQQALHHIAVFDTRKMLRLRNYHSYFIVHEDDPALSKLKGERLW
jgi:hypothetical protein